FATALVPVPEITVTDSVAPANDLTIPYGSVTEMTSANRTVTVTNDGTANLNIGNLATVDTLAAPFSLLNDMCSGQLLAPMASCTTTVVFAPTATGAFNDSFDIPSDDADEPSVTMSLTGTGTAMPVPDINVTDSIAPADDASVPFGSVTINQSAPPATVTVTNSGNADLLLGQIAPLTAPFVIADDNCSNATVMPMMNCTLMVTFMPTVVGPANGTLTIPSNDPDSPNVAVAVSGTGAPMPTPDITVMDVAVAFGAVTINDSSTQTVVVTNDGTADLTIGTVAMADPLAAPFSVAMDGCSSQVLMPMDSCMIDLTFAPTATGVANDSLDIPSDDPDETSVTVNVSGTGSDPTVFQDVPDSPEGSDSGFFGSMDLISLFAMLLVLVGYRRTQWGLRRV
ncbi:MAG: choice-of-anchor D domain-containing protein, partial [Gammaproteobacteria bacterium]|nr:choice-of-anchor D domain-containing protein [Gammaproteobacteria bacterium]